MALGIRPTPRYGALGGQGGYPLNQTGGGFANMLTGGNGGGLLGSVSPQVANQPLANPIDPHAIPPLMDAGGVSGTEDPSTYAPGSPQNPLPNPNHPDNHPDQSVPPVAPVNPQGDATIQYVPGLSAPKPLPTAGDAPGDPARTPSGTPGDPAALAGRADPFTSMDTGGGNFPNYPDPPTLPQWGGDEGAFRQYYGMPPAQAPAQNTPPPSNTTGAPTTRTGSAGRGVAETQGAGPADATSGVGASTAPVNRTIGQPGYDPLLARRR